MMSAHAHIRPTSTQAPHIAGPGHAVESPADNMFTLRIRPAQLEALAALSRRRFVDNAVLHLRQEHPERWAAAADASVRAWAERRLARGEALGLIEEAALLRHIEVASRLTERFAESPDAIGVLHDHAAVRDWPPTWDLLQQLHRADAS